MNFSTANPPYSYRLKKMNEKGASSQSLQIHTSKILSEPTNVTVGISDSMRSHVTSAKQPSFSGLSKVVTPGTKLANLIFSAEKTLKMIRAQKKNNSNVVPANLNTQSNSSNNQSIEALATVQSLTSEKNDSVQKSFLQAPSSILQIKNAKVSAGAFQSLLGKRFSSQSIESLQAQTGQDEQQSLNNSPLNGSSQIDTQTSTSNPSKICPPEHPFVNIQRQIQLKKAQQSTQTRGLKAEINQVNSGNFIILDNKTKLESRIQSLKLMMQTLKDQGRGLKTVSQILKEQYQTQNQSVPLHRIVPNGENNSSIIESIDRKNYASFAKPLRMTTPKSMPVQLDQPQIDPKIFLNQRNGDQDVAEAANSQLLYDSVRALNKILDNNGYQTQAQLNHNSFKKTLIKQYSDRQQYVEKSELAQAAPDLQEPISTSSPVPAQHNPKEDQLDDVMTKKLMFQLQESETLKQQKWVPTEVKPDDKADSCQKDHICTYCNEAFKSAQSLGGHISRKHPKSSENYKKKMARRQERAQERHILELAKQEHRKQYGTFVELNRVKIRKFKRDIRMQIEIGQLKEKHNICSLDDQMN